MSDPRMDVLRGEWLEWANLLGGIERWKRLLAAFDAADSAAGYTRVPPPVDMPVKDLRTGDMVWHALGSCRTVQQVTLSDDRAVVEVEYADGTRGDSLAWLLVSVSRPEPEAPEGWAGP